MKAEKESPRYAVPALDHGLDVLEALSASPVPQSLSDLARTLDYKPSGLFRLLARLERRRYILRDPVSGMYSLTLKLFELAHTHPPVEDLMRSAAGPMRELAASAGESVHLSVISHGRLVVLLDVGSPSRVRISIEVGSQFAPVETNSGRLLLAHFAEEDLAAFLAQDPEYAAMSPARRRRFQADLDAIRGRDHSISPSVQQPGVTDIAALVGNPAIGQAAALAIACLGDAASDRSRRLAAALERSAAAITMRQGLSHDRCAIL